MGYMQNSSDNLCPRFWFAHSNRFWFTPPGPSIDRKHLVYGQSGTKTAAFQQTAMKPTEYNHGYSWIPYFILKVYQNPPSIAKSSVDLLNPQRADGPTL